MATRKPSTLAVKNGGDARLRDLTIDSTLQFGADAAPFGAVVVAERTFTETVGAGVWTGSVVQPAGSELVDILVHQGSLWDSETSATLIVGDATDDDGYFTGVNLKATDLLAGESLSLALAGGKAGSYIANSHALQRYAATDRTLTAKVTKVGSTGSAGRTRVSFVFALGAPIAATKA